MRMLLEGDFGPITWKRRSYLYEQGLLLRQVLVIDHDDDDDHHFDHMGKKKLSVQAWSSDQFGVPLSVINDVDPGRRKV